MKKEEKTRRITLAAMPGRARIWEIPVMQYLEDHGNGDWLPRHRLIAVHVDTL